MTPEEERAGYAQSIATIEQAPGTRPVGFNAFWLRGTRHTLEILQDLGELFGGAGHGVTIARHWNATTSLSAGALAIIRAVIIDRCATEERVGLEKIPLRHECGSPAEANRLSRAVPMIAPEPFDRHGL
jgi:hypothetical protein